ncbi:DUF2254 domain-containing protein [Gangjinia marincola]|uniref:DUF2254 domain-containing protein n=1 Tax=Gangjinia marincola TaxID=578463 RepID=A0ABN1MD51_9FLAO
MKKIFKKTYIALFNNIWFYPSFIAILGLVIAVGISYAETRGLSSYVMERIPQIIIDNKDTSLTVLSTLIGSLISIMVFSFSMVMILLNQASSNFSPRLLPGLVSDRKHQIVLGVYLATIIYCLFIMVSIKDINSKTDLPGFSVLLAIFFMIVCLFAFIYFIHTISQTIQVGNILEKVFHTGCSRLNSLIENERKHDFTKDTLPQFDQWKTYPSKKSGYFQQLFLEDLLEILKEHDIQLRMLAFKGKFVLEGSNLFQLSKEASEEIIEKIYASMIYSNSELIKENYLHSFKQITEIGIKAMSPGINDPGTMLNSLDYLAQLFERRMKKNDIEIHFEEENPLIFYNSISFNTLLHNILISIRTYCSHDLLVIKKTSNMLNELLTLTSEKDSYYKDIKAEIESLRKNFTLNDNVLEDDKNELDNLISID